MKKTFLILSIIVLLAVIYLVIINYNNYAAVNFIQSGVIEITDKSAWVERSGYFVKAIRVSSYTLLILFAGLFAGAGTVYMFLQAQTDKLKMYQRELEKTSIAGDDNASRVEVLEAKIKTLEKAFNTVIDERTQLELQIKNLNTELDKINNKQG